MSEMESLRDILNSDHGDRVAIQTPVGRISFTSLSDQVGKVASALRAANLARGDVVSIVLRNTPEFVVAFLAVTAVGGVAAPLNPAYTAAEFEFYMEDAGAKVAVLHDTDKASHAAEAVVKLGIPAWYTGVADVGTGSAESSVTVHVDTTTLSTAETQTASYSPTQDDVALFLHTSGTTSRPKGVPLSHRNLLTSISNIAKTYALSSSDSTLLVMPLFHVHGLMAALLTSLSVGATVVLPPEGRFSASTFWKSVEDFGVTWYTAVPTIHQVLLLRYETDYPKDNPPSLRFIRSCSASLAPAVLAELESKFGAPVLEAYAMTEAAHQMTSNPLPERGPHRAGSVGPGQNVRIAILNDDNVPQPAGTVGEVCIQGENVTSGYRKNPDANKAAFAGGWFHTGDQGFLDEEGYLTLTGRIKELINRGGEKISPLELDAAMLEHPCVAEAVSFSAPDSKYGEEVNAAIVLKPSMSATAGELQEFLKARVAHFKIPKRFFFDTSLPRTATGKIQRRKVAEHFLQAK